MNLGGLAGCCCDVECDFFLDEFTLADDEDPGADWTEVSGDWDIVSNAVSTTDDDAALICVQEHPEGEPNIAVTAQVTISTNNDTARIILDYVDSNNYWFIEVKAATSGAYIRIYQRTGGTNTQRATQNAIRTTGTFVFCGSVYGSSIEGRVGDQFVSYEASFSEPVFGIGTGTIAGTIAFTTVSVARTSDHCPPCGQSCTSCSTGEGPGQLKVVVPAGTFEHQVGAVNGCEPADCDNADGTYYLTPAWGVSSGGFPTFDGGHVVNASQCAYAVCVDTADCVEPNKSVLRAVMALITTSSGNTRIRVILSNNAHLIAIDGGSGTECSEAYTNLAEGLYLKTFSGIVDCSAWESEVIDFSSRVVGSGTDLCKPKTTSSVEVTAV